MGFNILFYIIFGTNLLTKGPVQIAVFAYFSVSQKRNIERNETFARIFLGTNTIQETWSGSQRRNKAATRQEGTPRGQERPHPRGPLAAPPTYSFCLYILIYPENIQEHHETLFPPPQPSVPVRSHLGTFSGVLPKGHSTMEGFYINTIASPMMCEQFTSDLRVHSYQLDGFFSLFGSQYKFLLDLLGDLFDVTLFAVCLSRSDELWVYDQDYL